MDKSFISKNQILYTKKDNELKLLSLNSEQDKYTTKIVNYKIDITNGVHIIPLTINSSGNWKIGVLSNKTKKIMSEELMKNNIEMDNNSEFTYKKTVGDWYDSRSCDSCGTVWTQWLPILNEHKPLSSIKTVIIIIGKPKNQTDNIIRFYYDICNPNKYIQLKKRLNEKSCYYIGIGLNSYQSVSLLDWIKFKGSKLYEFIEKKYENKKFPNIEKISTFVKELDKIDINNCVKPLNKKLVEWKYINQLMKTPNEIDSIYRIGVNKFTTIHLILLLNQHVDIVKYLFKNESIVKYINSEPYINYKILLLKIGLIFNNSYILYLFRSNVPEQFFEWLPFHIACQKGKDRVLKHLFKFAKKYNYKKYYNSIDSDGKTILWHERQMVGITV